jgi:hypothetical protein
MTNQLGKVAWLLERLDEYKQSIDSVPRSIIFATYREARLYDLNRKKGGLEISVIGEARGYPAETIRELALKARSRGAAVFLLDKIADEAAVKYVDEFRGLNLEFYPHPGIFVADEKKESRAEPAAAAEPVGT